MIATPNNWLKARLGYGFGAQFRPWVGLDYSSGLLGFVLPPRSVSGICSRLAKLGARVL